MCKKLIAFFPTTLYAGKGMQSFTQITHTTTIKG